MKGTKAKEKEEWKEIFLNLDKAANLGNVDKFIYNT